MSLNILRIQQIMLEKGINQKEIATIGDIQTSTLSKILSGKTKRTNIKTIYKIAKGLDVDPKDIVKGVD